MGYVGTVTWTGAMPSGSCKYVGRDDEIVRTPEVVDEGPHHGLHLLKLVFAFLLFL